MKMRFWAMMAFVVMAMAAMGESAVNNVRVEQQGKKIVIMYDLDKDAYVSSLMMNSYTDRNVEIDVKYLEGDVMMNVRKGVDYKIVYDVMKEYPFGFLKKDVVFSVEAKEPKKGKEAMWRDELIALKEKATAELSKSAEEMAAAEVKKSEPEVKAAKETARKAVGDAGAKGESGAGGAVLKKDRHDMVRVFVMALGAYTNKPQYSYGLMLGVHKRYAGGYVKFRLNEQVGAMNYNYYVGDGTGAVEGVVPYYTGVSKKPQLMVTAGATFRLAKPLYVYIGLGYGERDLLQEMKNGEWVKMMESSYRGVSSELGGILSFGRFALSVGVSNINFKYVEVEAGIGFRF